MENAVIYARFSSHGQNEQTIEGQVRICKEFAESKGFNAVRTYFDKAKTGTNDNRPEFQRMIRDAAGGAYKYIVIYKFDRFARNRRDSVMYKEMLREKYGVKVVSATEPISDDEGGEFYEMFLEWNDEKYSKRLSKRIKDGLTTAIDNGTYTGARLIFGYALEDTDKIGKKGTIKKVIIDEEQAAIVRYIFSEYASGKKKTEIAAALNAQGHRIDGGLFSVRSFDHWLINEKYTGTFSYGGRVNSKQFPRIIDQETFNAVQERLAANRQLAGAFSAREPYILTGAAYCGKCRTPMVADGATGRTGKHHKYYACKQKKKNLCTKKREPKDPLERSIIFDMIEFLSDPENVERIARDTIAHQEQRTSADGVKAIETKIAHAQKQVKEWAVAFVEAKSALLRTIIEKQIADYEILLRDLDLQKTKLEMERGNKVTRKGIFDFVNEFINCDPNDKESWQRMIDALVKRVYIYDDDHSVLFNFTDEDIEQITIEDMEAAIDGAKCVQTLTPTLHQDDKA